MEKKLRRLENNLVIAGTGLLAFSFWSIIRTVLLMVTYRKEISQYIEDLSKEDGVEVPPFLVIIVVIILVLLVLLPYIIIGRAARVDGMRKKRKKFYIVLALIMLLPETFVVIYSVSSIFTAGEEMLEALVTAMIDVTTLCVLGETVITALLVKKYRKLLESGGAK